MRKDIIVETATHETRIAMLEDNHLVELLVERPEHERVVGNICKGVVTAVIASIQAAFVDIGMDNRALHLRYRSQGGFSSLFHMLIMLVFPDG